jgi:hypothetical protein
VMIQVPAEREVRERWIEIRHLADNSLVTVIEVLPPTNKHGEGLADYLVKRRSILRQNVNLVEIDLLVGGRRMDQSVKLPPGDYYVMVSRGDRPGLREVYAWPLRRPLPPARVPLRPPEADVTLDLAAALALAFDRGRYARRLNYCRPPPVPLAESELTWATELAGKAGR